MFKQYLIFDPETHFLPFGAIMAASLHGFDRPKNMFFNFFFKQWPLHKQVSYIRRKGILIGSRTRDGRKIYIYMYHNHFAEVQFSNDDPEGEVERASIVKGLKSLNSYLENEFKENF